MSSWALTFFLVALTASILGSSGITATAGSIAEFLFFTFLVLLVISLFVPRVRPPSSRYN